MESNLREKNIELLAPAGSPEKMKYAFNYGADAVYAGVPDFSLRARINDFTLDSIKKGVLYAHELGKKFYLTLNIYPHNIQIEKLEGFLKELKGLEIDGIILSDPGIFAMVKVNLPDVDIHISTQANVTNWQAAKFWADQGATRIILAREVTLDEIREIKKRLPEVELEYFVHGAMCMSYSGRCILSKWMSGRSANLGDCSQPCRWLYNQRNDQFPNYKSQTNFKSQIPNSKNTKTMDVIDRKGEFEIDLEEDQHGTYFFNSKDLNLIEHLKDLMDAGVESFKIEGRNKSVYYLALIIRAYRNVLDSIISEKDYDDILNREKENINSLVNRGYTKGFLLGEEPEHNFTSSHNLSNFEFVGEVINVENDLVKIKPHNAIYLEDDIEIIDTKGNHAVKLEKIFSDDMEEAQSAHGGQGKFYYLKLDKKDVKSMSLIRKTVK